MNSTKIEKQYALQKWAGIIKQQQECTLSLKELLIRKVLCFQRLILRTDIFT